MKLKVEYVRRPGRSVDLIITTEARATVGDIARAVLRNDPAGGPVPEHVTFEAAAPGSASFVRLPPDRTVGEARITSGYAVRIAAEHAPPETASAEGPEVALLTVRSAGEEPRDVRLTAGSHLFGRGPRATIRVRDPLVSGVHARIDVGDTLVVTDLNSANGVEVEGELVKRWVAQPEQATPQPIVLGDTTVTLSHLGTSAPAWSEDEDATQGAAIPFNRSPRVELRYPGREHPRPQVPRDLEHVPFPWLMMLVPFLLGGIIFAITRSPLSLVLLFMSPMMLIANFWMARQRRNRRSVTEVGRFRAQFEALETTLGVEAAVEVERRLAEVVSVDQVRRAGLEVAAPLWTRRPEHWNFLHLRLGVGRMLSRNQVAAAPAVAEGLPEFDAEVAALEERFRYVDGVPVSEDLRRAGALGVVSHGEAGPDVVRALLLQLAGLYSPAELVLTAVVPTREAADLEWLTWLPHTSSVHSPFEVSHLADSPVSAAVLVSALEAVVSGRRGPTAGSDDLGPLAADDTAVDDGARVGDKEPGESVATHSPVVVVLVVDGAPVDRGRLVQLAERGPSVGVHVVWVAPAPESLPAACRTFVDLRGGASSAEVHFVRQGEVVAPVHVDRVTSAEALAFARRVSGVVDAGAVVADQSDLPTSLSMLSLQEADLTLASQMLDRWRETQSILSPGPRRSKRPAYTLRALVGQGGTGAVHLDLRAEGPHALVGGTTGAGKSEFLQAWVIGMAAEYSPQRVTFLFVDFKGGAAFADCLRLPHSVGLVSDLEPHMLVRVLDSLKAELRNREHLIHQKQKKDPQIKDLQELERRRDPDTPPALVIVIDEFAALATVMPEFVDGVVDVAQRGRSLGIHLIMATQRPAGVITANLKANTNLRVALRMADEGDSVDVVGDAMAAWFDQDTPGRGVVKTGSGRLRLFQSAFGGLRSQAEPPPPDLSIHELGFGVDVAWPDPETVADDDSDAGSSDLRRLVDAAIGAAELGELSPPVRPWQDPLTSAYDLVGKLTPLSDARLVLGMADRPQDQWQDAAYFDPDRDGNLLVYGTSGAGKTVLLRTLAASVGLAPAGGPVHVYGLDFAAGGLQVLKGLPHVGAVIAGSDTERVVRLLRRLRTIADERARAYPLADAGDVAAYRTRAGRPDEPRILVLLDGYPAFREEFEGVSGLAASYVIFQQLLVEGRKLGIHLVLTADRSGAVPTTVSASVPRRIVMRMADDGFYGTLDLPAGMLSRTSPPGRAVVDGVSLQVAVLGGSGDESDQAQAMQELGARLLDSRAPSAPGVAFLPQDIPLTSMPPDVGGQPVLGLADLTLASTGFDPTGAMMLAGPPGSGRTTAMAAIAESYARFDREAETYFIGHARSAVPGLRDWTVATRSDEEAAALAKTLLQRVTDGDGPRLVLVVESLTDYFMTPAETPLAALFKAIKRSESLVVAEADLAGWGYSYPIITEIRSARRGMLLQPDHVEAENLLRTPVPRAVRTDFPPGRGLYVDRGTVVRVQLPHL